MKKPQAEKKRIVVGSSGDVHTISEKLYTEISEAVVKGNITSYLIHPNKAIRLLAELKLKYSREGKN